MKITCPRKDLLEAVSAASAGASNRTSVHILKSLLIEANTDSVRLLGCDGEMWVERTLPAVVMMTGALCIPASLLKDLLSSMPDGDVNLTVNEGVGAVLSQGTSEYRLQSMDGQDFPEPPGFDRESEITLTLSELRSAIQSVIYAVSADFHRQVLTGVLFTYDGEVLTLVATDTHRLAVRKIARPGIGSNINVIVPDKALKAFIALPIADDEPITLRFGSGRVGTECQGAKIVSQLLAGSYPTWQRVVPAESTRSWLVETDHLRAKVSRAMILARDNASRVRFSGDADQVVITARSEEKGQAREDLTMISDNGAIEIAFNGKYVLDALAHSNSPGLRIEMTESSRPAIFRAADDDDGFCVIMPMALAPDQTSLGGR